MLPTVTFKQTQHAQQAHLIKRYFTRLAGPIDSFLEEHIFAARLYAILLDGATVGLTAVHNESLLSLFTLNDTAVRWGDSIFAQARRLEKVNRAFVPSGDAAFMAFAAEHARAIQPQAYFFRRGPQSAEQTPSFTLSYATQADAAQIKANSGDFLDPLTERIEQQQIFIGRDNDQVVSYGIREMSRISAEQGSIGMFVLAEQRQKGYGTQTIRALIALCESEGVAPVAGCWYYNHNSRKTLERAGLITDARLFKVTL